MKKPKDKELLTEVVQARVSKKTMQIIKKIANRDLEGKGDWGRVIRKYLIIGLKKKGEMK